MEKKTIFKLSLSAVIVILAVLFTCGIVGGKEMSYQVPGPYAAEDTNDFSTVKVEAMIAGEEITDVKISSSGDTDLLNDALRDEWAQSILDAQSADNDVISGATLTYSAGSVKAAMDDILAQAGLKEESAEPEPEAEPEPAGDEGDEAAPESAGGLADGSYAVQKTTDFSTIDVGFTVEGGAITDASVTSEGANDLLTDDNRSAWADQIVEKQAVDTISGVTISSTAVQEAVEELMAQASAGGGSAGGLADGSYAVQKTTDFSTIDVGFTVEDGAITDASVTSEGANDLLTDDNRAAWADQIVEKQAVDAISGVTISSTAVQEAVEELMAQASAGGDSAADDARIAELEAAVQAAEAKIAELESAASEAEAKAVEAEAKVAELEAAAAAAAVAAAPEAEEAEAPAEPAAGLADGSYAVQKTTDFSTIDVGFTVEGGVITDASVTSEGANDLLTDDNRAAWADQIVEKQSVDAVSGVTVSSTAVQEAVEELMAQASAGGAAEAAETEAEAPEATGDAERLMRAQPILSAVEPEAHAEAETETAETEAPEATGDAERLMRAQPVLSAVEAEGAADTETDEATTDEEEAEAAPAETAAGDADALMRAKPALSATETEEAAETEEAEEADTETEAAEAEEAPEAGALADGTYTAESANDFSTVTVTATVENGAITEATVASDGGPTDLLTDEIKAEWSQAIVDAQSADADAITGATLTFSAGSVKEAVDSILAQAGGEVAEAERSADLSAVLPYIVTSMGDNRENSYVVSYLEQDPYLVNIYEGYGFAKDYGSARGHEYTLEDVSKTQRPHPKANCLTCKTPDYHKLVEQEGVGVYSMDFDTVMAQMTNNISCYTCHGDDMGNGGALAVTHQYVNEALGDNVAAIDPASMACGQCHIEYYFTPQDSETMMPYHSVEEMTPEAILAYYDAMDFADWTQESTGTRMLKAQHPELETYLQGKHANMLSCADCHMPPATTDEGVAYRSHTLVSPLESEALLESCAKCHGETDMVEFVHGIQDAVTARETEVGNALSDMKDALADAVSSGTWSEEDLDAVRKLHREAQWYFDFCYVENAEGAHNSQLALSCLDTSEAKIKEALALLEKT